MLESDIKDLLYLFWTLAWLVTIALILLSSWLCTWLSPGCFAGLFTWTSLLQVLLDTLLFWSCALSCLPSRELSPGGSHLGSCFHSLSLRWRMSWLSWTGEEQILLHSWWIQGKSSALGVTKALLAVRLALCIALWHWETQHSLYHLFAKQGFLHLHSFLLGFWWVPYSLKRIEVLLLSALSFLTLF